MDEQLGRVVMASVVDHIKPHRGNLELFLDADNLQSLCKRCHDGHKQAQEHNSDGILRGAGHDGRPLDLAHPWHHPVGGVEKSTTTTPKTGPVPFFAEPRNGRGGLQGGDHCGSAGGSA